MRLARRSYRALLDARAVAAWRVPDGMTSQVHEFDAREGGRFRVSLTYDASTGTGKTSPDTDTYHGHFARLVPDEQVVEVVEFETADPAMQGEIKITTMLTDADGGTEIAVAHEGLPPGLPEAANETGTRMALAKLAALVERDIDAWFAELDRFADVPFMEDGRRQPPMSEPKDPKDYR